MTPPLGVVLVNPNSGNGTDVDAISQAFDHHRVVVCDPDSFETAIRDALDGDPPRFIAMAGGDGSMRTLAAALAGTDVAMLAVPEGTRNHLARDLGITSVDDAVTAAEGTERCIDLGDVNGEVFVNTMSLGVYPAMVRERARRAKAWPKPIANLFAALHQVRDGRRSTIELDGTPYRVWSVFVGNGQYGNGLTDLTSRDDLADGQLDVRIVRADRPLARTRVVLATLVGRLDRSPLLESRRTATLTIQSTRPTLDVALDGEVLHLATPLRVSCRQGSLRVLVPSR